MNGSRTSILEWIEEGKLPPDKAPEALRLAGVMPRPRDWGRFFDQLTLWLGTVFCAAAVIFFFAYNWKEMGRFAKFGLVECFIIASLALCWRLDLERTAGKAVLLLATLLTGALLALVGQIYQTGADTYELFAAWAIASFAWVVIARFGALWLVWLALLNLAAIFYFQTFGGFFGLLFSPERRLWALFGLNTAALLIWEIAASRGVEWLRERWSARILATASGSMITALMIWAIVDFDRTDHVLALPVYAMWMGAVYYYYRQRCPDLFVLAGGVLSGIVVVTVFLSKHLLRHNEGGGFLFIGLIIIGLSAWGGLWLKSVAAEERT
ncbi:MAG: DUF2157 domain-containing protein [Burkholderiales bacterium]|nr:DUF2157 domain-containing protein [Burkholderiales bacterium]